MQRSMCARGLVGFFCGLFVCSSFYASEKKPLRVLHMSFHQGCIQDFEDVGKTLGFDVVSWHILSYPLNHFDGEATNLTLYNITHDRAEKVWKKHKNFFETFDVVMVSDIAPLARIFLQNKWQKPLIIWICNRFDYYMEGTIKGFPDQEMYDFFSQAALQKNVKVVSSSPYEHIYAYHRGVEFSTYTIRPIGASANKRNGQAIPNTITKEKLLFVYPNEHAHYIQGECDKIGLATYTGRFNGPEDLRGFRGIIYFPYQILNLVFWEGIQRGIIFFVPSKRFLRSMIKKNMVHEYCRLPNVDEFVDWSDWYADEHQDVIVYFDSWQDLKEKVGALDYSAICARITRYAQYHRETVLYRWKEVFHELSHGKGYVE